MTRSTSASSGDTLIPMIPLFLGLTGFNLLMLTATLALGYVVRRDPMFWGTYHQLAGVLATISCIAVHCVVFTYFIATAKWVQHAVTVKQLDPAFTAPTRSFKAQAFPAALLAMAVVFATAVTGAGTVSGFFRTTALHHVLAWTTMLVNLLVAAVEYRAISRNARLIDQILASIPAAEGAACNAS